MVGNDGALRDVINKSYCDLGDKPVFVDRRDALCNIAAHNSRYRIRLKTNVMRLYAFMFHACLFHVN